MGGLVHQITKQIHILLVALKERGSALKEKKRKKKCDFRKSYNAFLKAHHMSDSLERHIFMP